VHNRVCDPCVIRLVEMESSLGTMFGKATRDICALIHVGARSEENRDINARLESNTSEKGRWISPAAS
jgi:hypothetical protein